MPVISARSRLLTTREAAELLNVSPRTITKWISEDRVSYLRLPGGEYRLPLSALLDSLSGTYDLAAELQAYDNLTSGRDFDEEEAAAVAAEC